MELEKVRIDKWLWSVRIFKTRTLATDQCERGKVLIDEQRVKPSRDVKVGQIVVIKKDGIEYHYEILKCIETRVGAPIAQACYRDLTPAENIEKLKLVHSQWVPRRDKGAGRPTKRERREMEKVFGEPYVD